MHDTEKKSSSDGLKNFASVDVRPVDLGAIGKWSSELGWGSITKCCLLQWTLGNNEIPSLLSIQIIADCASPIQCSFSTSNIPIIFMKTKYTTKKWTFSAPLIASHVQF